MPGGDAIIHAEPAVRQDVGDCQPAFAYDKSSDTGAEHDDYDEAGIYEDENDEPQVLDAN